MFYENNLHLISLNIDYFENALQEHQIFLGHFPNNIWFKNNNFAGHIKIVT